MEHSQARSAVLLFLCLICSSEPLPIPLGRRVRRADGAEQHRLVMPVVS